MAFTLTNLYNNTEGEPGLDAAWGFACLITRGDDAVLFDTGGDGAILIANARALGVDLRRVRAVVLSHGHWDHMGGLWDALRAIGPVDLYHPKSLSEPFQNHARKLGARPVGVAEETGLADGISVLPEMGSKVKEQVLLLEGSRGLAVLTGCAHPGIVEIVAAAARLRGRPVTHVLGGFHLFESKPARVKETVAALRRQGVARVSPCHCTGTPAVELFTQSFGDSFSPIGCGDRMQLDL